MKMINIKENLLIFWKTWKKWKFSEKMWLDNTEIRKKAGLHPLFEKYIYWKNHRGEGGANWPPSQDF